METPRKTLPALALAASAGLAVVLGGPGIARAGVLATIANADQNYGGTATAPVKLASNGATALPFTTTLANQQVVVTLNGVCTATGAATGWLNVQVTVDQQATLPDAGVFFSMCSATAAKAYTATSRQVIYNVPQPGTHQVRVTAAATAGATYWRLADTSLVVMS